MGKRRLSRSPSPTGSDRSDRSSAAPSQSTGVSKRARLEEKFAGKSSEEILETQMKGWKSAIYKHFLDPVIFESKPGIVKYRFKCRAHPSESVVRAQFDPSTGNLNKHVSSCEPASSAESQAMAAFASGSTYSEARFRTLVALWVARRHRPFRIIEDEELQDIFRMLNARVKIHSRHTISRDVQEIFALTRSSVIEALQLHPGRLHIGVDGWTSPNVYSFLGVTVTRCVQGKTQTMILDFIKMTKEHDGIYLARKLGACLESYKIEDKVLGIVCDNAENNSTMITQLATILPHFKGSLARIRCFAHILNLVVKAILSQFARKRKTKTSDNAGHNIEEALASLDDPADAEDEDEPEHPSDDDHGDDEEDEDELERNASDQLLLDYLDTDIEDNSDVDVLISEDEVNSGRLALHKITQLARKVFHSPTVREELARLCAENGLEAQVLVRPVATRWNTITDVIHRALKLRPVLDELCKNLRFNKSKGIRLRRFILDDDEWDIIEELHPLLDLFLYVTKEVSQSSVPLIHQVIPFMDTLTEALDDWYNDITKPAAVRIAAKRGRTMLDKYYGKSDDSIIYRIAMILHPAYKTEYFRQQQWPQSWIDTAVELARQEWREHYKSRPTVAASADAPSVAASSSSSVSQRQKYFGKMRQSNDTDAFETYISSPAIPSIQDPLAYWSTSQDPLAEMAIDFLSAPATSVDTERGFSRGGKTVSKLRHSLSDKSTRAATVLGSWADAGMVNQADIIGLMKSKKSTTSSG